MRVSKHARERMRERNIRHSDVHKRGTKSGHNSYDTQYGSNYLRVIVKNAVIVTTFVTSRSKVLDKRKIRALRDIKYAVLFPSEECI